MVGHGRPSALKVLGTRCAFWQIGLGTARLFFCGLVLTFCCSALSLECFAAEKTVRLRLAWGSGNAAKQRWTGSISIDGGVLSELQPLGIETDAPVAIRIDGSRLVVTPLEKRGFDGCDVMVRADEQALVRVELRGEQMPQAAVFEAPLEEVIRSQLSRPIDELGSYFLARRSPGDVLRVLPTRDHLVFGPNEKWTLKLQPDLAKELAAGTVLIDVQLRATDAAKSNWRSTQQIHDATQLDGGVDFEIVCPPTEGAYRLTVTARAEEGFATRFVPGQQVKPFATRDVEFVVIDPVAKLPRLVDQWLPVLTIDPANPHWWQRLPTWAQVPRLRDRNPGAIGNVRPVVRPTPTGELVELPPAIAGSDPSWQSYTLPVREPGKPHLIEIEYPIGVEQNLVISVVEPDAAGRVTATHQDGSLQSEGLSTARDGAVGVHRFMIWPRSRSPQLLIVNRHPSKPALYGKIKLLKQDTSIASLTDLENANGSARLVAGYLAKPLLASSFGAAEVLDNNSGLSVHSWSTFLDGARRLSQSLRLNGYNGVLISVAADGSGLYPSRVINPSPRYDTGLLSASGQDPQRKDVLEMLLRVFDREGIRVFPTVQLAAPLPRLERLRLGSDVRTSGIGCVGYHGQSWLAENPTSQGLAPFYNPLNDQVQAELVEMVAELTTRYGHHSSLAGVGVQLSGEGYGQMPGLAWGMDDRTVAEFSQATGIATPSQSPDRFRQRADLLLGKDRLAWQSWRTEKLSQLYTRLSQQVSADRSDLRLILTTEEVFSGQELQQRVRQAIANTLDFGEILLDHGIDIAQLNAQPKITALIPHRLSPVGHLQERAIDLRVNSAAEQGDLLATEQRSAELFFGTTSHFRLPSFDAISPFGVEQTYLTVSTQPHFVGAGQRQPILTAMATNDSLMIVEGGQRLAQNLDPQSHELLHTIQQLPGANTSGHTQRQQPVVMRVYRAEQQTNLALINESPWPVHVNVTLTGSHNGEWSKLISPNEQATAIDTLAGTMTDNPQTWQLELQPYDLQAWRFEDEKLRIGELEIALTDIAQQELERRIAEIESRSENLRIKRPYAQLQNPDFEFESEDGSEHILGWQTLQGTSGAILIENTGSHSGAKALRLKSEDATGVAVQSNLFPAPETGQLLVGVYLRFDQLEPTAQLQITVQDQNGGRRYSQSKQLGNEQIAGKGWAYYDFTLGDVPFGLDKQLQIQFHLRGKGDVLVDDVQLYDLQFAETQRRALVKRIFAARIALEQGQVIDCLRVVNDYWSQYLMEYVPPTGSIASLATRSQDTAEPVTVQPSEADKKGIGSRLRDWVPRRWR